MLSKITEGLIRQHASTQSFSRGQEYFAEGAVTSLGRRGAVLEAEVEGSQPWPYDVRIEFDEGGIFAASCSCPYDWGDWCKHIVAVLLAYIDERETITERPTVESLLSGLDRNQLQTLLLGLVESEPSLANQIEEKIPLLSIKPDVAPTSHAAEPQPRHIPLDTASFRNRVHSILQSVDEAVEEGMRSLADADEALALAKKLREVGALEGALRIGERGLDLEGHSGRLAEWLIDVASGTGNAALALKASLMAFRETSSLAAYLRVQELAEDRWAAYRSELLDYLRQTGTHFTSGKVDVFLHEGLVADAMAMVERGTIDSVVEKVAEAAIASHPDRVIQICLRYAQSIMDGAKAQHYDEAVNWLARARKAYHASGRQTEWRQYRQELLGLHGRKYKLVAMLKALKD